MLNDCDERDADDDSDADHLQPQFEPLRRRDAGVLSFLVGLHFVETLLFEPADRLHRADGRQPGQGLGEVGVDRRQRRRADAFEISRCGSVAMLHVVQDESERNEDDDDPEMGFIRRYLTRVDEKAQRETEAGSVVIYVVK